MKDEAELRTADLSKARLGRYPFLGGIKYYEARYRPYLSPYTFYEDGSKLRLFGRILEDLKSDGRIRNTDPRRMTKADIEGFMIWMKEKGHKPSTREKYLKVLKKYLQLFGNDVLYAMWRENRHLMPKDTNGEIKALTVEELQIVMDAAATVKNWRGAVMRGMIALAFATGCRPGEILRSEISDLDLRKERFYVRHPKGEGSWGKPQWIPIIRGDMTPMLRTYILVREEKLAELAADISYIFFNPRTMRHYTERGSNAMMTTLSRISGIDINLKDLRPTLCSITIDGDLSRLKAMSLQLRHKNVATTEEYYARIYTGAIEREIGDVWREKRIQ